MIEEEKPAEEKPELPDGVEIEQPKIDSPDGPKPFSPGPPPPPHHSQKR